MESRIREVWKFWDERKLILPSQLGFIPGSSCTSQLLQSLDDVTSAVDQGQLIDVVYLDFKKAFNSVPHVRLLGKLSALGIKGTLNDWICSFLCDCKELVVVDGCKSSPKEMISGVPKGRCLGPLLFISYVNDIDDWVTSSSVLKYADDIKLYFKYSYHNQQAISNMETDLASLENWALQWQLKFNISKCTTLNSGQDY